MCGRFAFTTPLAILAKAFPDFQMPDGSMPENWEPSYNIAPTQLVPVVANTPELQIDFFRWGLIPSWAKDPSIGNRMINARSETIAEKPSFRTAFRKRRCVMLVDGFYEWRKEPDGKNKTPIHVKMKTGEPFLFAGLWEKWKSPEDDLIRSCTIITTTPNDLMGRFHHRMPVILPRDAQQTWLDPEPRAPQDLLPLLRPYPPEEMVAYPVSKMVNSPRNDSPDCIVQEGAAIEQTELEF